MPPSFSKTRLKGKKPEDIHFPEYFVFGTATAAWQVEKAAGESQWSQYEKLKNKDGKPLIPDHKNACEAIEHFDGDLKIIKSIKSKQYRFGISWSALEPEKGSYNDKYMDNYIKMCDKLMSEGIEPMITLWHFEYPLWLSQEGGLLSPGFVEHFCRFVEYASEKLKGHCNTFLTVNEPISYAMCGYLLGTFPPQHFLQFTEAYQVCGVILDCHARAYKILHRIIPGCRVSFAKQIIPFVAKHSWSVIEHLICAAANCLVNFSIMDATVTGVLTFRMLGIVWFQREIEGLAGSLDFLAINHYTCLFASVDPRDWDPQAPLLSRRPDRATPLSQFGWSLVPESLEMTMRWTDHEWNPRNIPIIVTEHGASDSTDKLRMPFTVDSLAFLAEAVGNGIPVRGYLHWSLLDNYEWADGYEQNFGLVAVDLDTQERTVRPTADALARIFASNE